MQIKIISLLVFYFFFQFNKLPVQQIQFLSGFKSGMVVSAYPEASKIGVEILKKGGNAVDAAVATGFALSVCYPAAGNIGGGGFMVIRLADGKAISIDYREKAPEKAFRDMFLDSSKNVIADMSQFTHAASGVPGSVDGMIEAHKKYGKLPFKELIQPSIDLAEKGFKVSAKLAKSLNAENEHFIKVNRKKPDFVKKEGKWKEGDVLIQKDLAKTLKLIRNKGRDGFYSGETANKIVAEMKRGNGFISLNDLKNYKSVWRPVVAGTYRGYKIISMAPPSSGGVALLQLLKLVEPYPLDKWPSNDLKSIHLMVEAEKLVFADRSTHLGDNDFEHVPVKELLDETYLKNRMSGFDENKARKADDIKPGKPVHAEKEETTHYSVTDQWGNAVSVTTTINGGYGSGIVVEGAGFLLNNEMDDFSIKPGYPNMFGLIGGEANAIEGNKRMLSSMTPTIIEKDGKLFMIVGSPGGSTIITSVFQTIVNVIDKGMDIQKAVSTPRFHHQWLPDVVSYEQNGFDKNLLSELEKMGHRFESRFSIGRVDAILVKPDGTYEGGADPRGDDIAVGY
ncbi:MAG: gamma-glutamyltransferase [Bacteroidales bacterium]